MTTRFTGLQVTLKQELREDDAQELIAAIKLLRGVVDVRPLVADVLSPAVLRERLALATRLGKLERELIGLPASDEDDED